MASLIWIKSQNQDRRLVKSTQYKNLVQVCKSLSEALLFAEHGENMLCTKIVLNVGNNSCTQHVLPRFELGNFMYWTCNSMNNLSSYSGLVDARIWASDKDLPVPKNLVLHNFSSFSKRKIVILDVNLSEIYLFMRLNYF